MSVAVLVFGLASEHEQTVKAPSNCSVFFTTCYPFLIANAVTAESDSATKPKSQLGVEIKSTSFTADLSLKL